MKSLFDQISREISKLTTVAYSTSFSLGIRVFNKKFHAPIYGIYGFVRLADEIVDSFHGFDKEKLLNEFKVQTYQAIEEKISLNPILNSFQHVVNEYHIERNLIDTFLQSMEMDLDKKNYDQHGYEKYILGSAEVVGLMCLRVFVDGDENKYNELKDYAMSLGSAFQKINFLRDLHADYHLLGRTYFPGVDLSEFNEETKKTIEEDIAKDFRHGYEGIKKLPKSVRLGVYLAYIYFWTLFRKIQTSSYKTILNKRVRIPNSRKIFIMIISFFKFGFSTPWLKKA